MRNVIHAVGVLTLCLSVTIPGCTEAEAPKLATPKQVTLHVDGMSCAENCAPRVKMHLEQVPGVTAVTVDFETKTAVCTLERDLGVDKLVGAIPHPFTAHLATNDDTSHAPK